MSGFEIPDLDTIEKRNSNSATRVPRVLHAQPATGVSANTPNAVNTTFTGDKDAAAQHRSTHNGNTRRLSKETTATTESRLVSNISTNQGTSNSSPSIVAAPTISKPSEPKLVRNRTANSSSSRSSGNAILVSPRQRGNPLLKHIKNVPWSFQKTVADFVVGATTCVLYLSLRYHLLHPDYLHTRMSELRRSYTLRVVLLHIDLADSTDPLLRVTTLASANDFTVMVVWSLEEAARYLETYKMFENKSATAIQKQVESDFESLAEDALTAIRSINRTDVKTLLREFGSVRGIMNASMEELSLCNGIGDKKVRFIQDALDVPFFD